MLLQILAVWPAPTAPAWKMLAPIFSSRGRARSSSAASPPTMKVSVPAMAPPVPPDTGASMNCTPCASAASATLCEVAAAMVRRVDHQRALGDLRQQARLAVAAEVQAVDMRGWRAAC